jgi:hypothetical protein
MLLAKGLFRLSRHVTWHSSASSARKSGPRTGQDGQSCRLGARDRSGPPCFDNRTWHHPTASPGRVKSGPEGLPTQVRFGPRAFSAEKMMGPRPGRIVGIIGSELSRRRDNRRSVRLWIPGSLACARAPERQAATSPRRPSRSRTGRARSNCLPRSPSRARWSRGP